MNKVSDMLIFVIVCFLVIVLDESAEFYNIEDSLEQISIPCIENHKKCAFPHFLSVILCCPQL